MTTTPCSHAAPAWLRELAAARTEYEEFVGWPVAIHVTAGTLMLPAGQLLDAVSMPMTLGTLVHDQLQMMMLDGPVVAGPGAGWLTFLTGLSGAAEPRLPVDLEHARVRPVVRGGTVVLPTAYGKSSAGEVWWFSPPRPRRMPPAWSVVIGVCRRVVASSSADRTHPQAA